MDNTEYIIGIICNLLEKKSPVILASIINMQGSSPRHNGTRMVININGSWGTIGGGLLEATTIKESRDILSTAQSKLLDFDLTGKNGNVSGMICGGNVQILLDYIPATTENQEFFRLWHGAVRSGKYCFFLTHFHPVNQFVEIINRFLLFPDGKIAGKCTLPDTVIENIRSELHNVSSTTVIAFEDTRVMIDPVRKLKTLYIFGAGHVAVPTAHMASLVGFKVIVIDDRAEFACTERFPDADEVRVIEDFNHALDGLPVNTDSFIVILTRGHQFDSVVLEQSLKTDAGYIGMISSRRKRDTIYDSLMAKGFKKEELEQVHSPIGLAINAETPEEIAVSITGELISERARQNS